MLARAAKAITPNPVWLVRYAADVATGVIRRDEANSAMTSYGGQM
jgi:hypothetical protein